jgi:hypothetical protein
MLLEDVVSRAEEEEQSGSSRGGPQRPWHMEDVVLFLSNDGDSEPIYLWRERPVASAPFPIPADAGQTLAAKEEVDAGLQALFEKYKLGAVCADVCSGLEVTCLDHLAYVGAQDVDDMAKSVKLKPFHIKIIKTMIAELSAAVHATGGQPSTSAINAVAAATRECGTAGTGPARRIYAFFAKHVDDSINVHGEAQRGDAGLAILIFVGEL